MKRIDLHTHTTKSDGTDSPWALVEKAGAAGLCAIGVTDHDTVAGVSEARAAGACFGVEVISGVELCAGWEGREIHLLGYFLDPESPALSEALDWVIKDRRDRNEKMAALMAADGLPVSAGELYGKYPQSTVGRPHFGEKLIELGLVSSVREAFVKYLDPGCKYYVRRNFLPLKKAAEVILAAGGRPVLAHPLQYKFTEDKLRELAALSRDWGVWGMECIYTGYSPQAQAGLFSLAESLGMGITGGSDYHGGHKPHIRLGELPVPESLLFKLRP